MKISPFLSIIPAISAQEYCSADYPFAFNDGKECCNIKRSHIPYSMQYSNRVDICKIPDENDWTLYRSSLCCQGHDEHCRGPTRNCTDFPGDQVNHPDFEAMKTEVMRSRYSNERSGRRNWHKYWQCRYYCRDQGGTDIVSVGHDTHWSLNYNGTGFFKYWDMGDEQATYISRVKNYSRKEEREFFTYTQQPNNEIYHWDNILKHCNYRTPVEMIWWSNVRHSNFGCEGSYDGTKIWFQVYRTPDQTIDMYHDMGENVWDDDLFNYQRYVEGFDETYTRSYVTPMGMVLRDDGSDNDGEPLGTDHGHFHESLFLLNEPDITKGEKQEAIYYVHDYRHENWPDTRDTFMYLADASILDVGLENIKTTAVRDILTSTFPGYSKNNDEKAVSNSAMTLIDLPRLHPAKKWKIFPETVKATHLGILFKIKEEEAEFPYWYFLPAFKGQDYNKVKENWFLIDSKNKKYEEWMGYYGRDITWFDMHDYFLTARFHNEYGANVQMHMLEFHPTTHPDTGKFDFFVRRDLGVTDGDGMNRTIHHDGGKGGSGWGLMNAPSHINFYGADPTPVNHGNDPNNGGPDDPHWEPPVPPNPGNGNAGGPNGNGGNDPNNSNPGWPNNGSNNPNNGNSGWPNNGGNDPNNGNPGSPNNGGNNPNNGNPGWPNNGGNDPNNGNPGSPNNGGNDPNNGNPGWPNNGGNDPNNGNPGSPNNGGNDPNNGNPGWPNNGGNNPNNGNPGWPNNGGDNPNNGNPGWPNNGGDNPNNGNPGWPNNGGNDPNNGNPGWPNNGGNDPNNGNAGWPNNGGNNPNDGNPGWPNNGGDNPNNGNPGWPNNGGNDPNNGNSGWPNNGGNDPNNGNPGWPNNGGDNPNNGNPGWPNNGGDNPNNGSPGWPNNGGDNPNNGNPGWPNNSGNEPNNGNGNNPNNNGPTGVSPGHGNGNNHQPNTNNGNPNGNNGNNPDDPNSNGPTGVSPGHGNGNNHQPNTGTGNPGLPNGNDGNDSNDPNNNGPTGVSPGHGNGNNHQPHTGNGNPNGNQPNNNGPSDEKPNTGGWPNGWPFWPHNGNSPVVYPGWPNGNGPGNNGNPAWPTGDDFNPNGWPNNGGWPNNDDWPMWLYNGGSPGNPNNGNGPSNGQPNNGNWPSNGQPNNGNGGWPNLDDWPVWIYNGGSPGNPNNGNGPNNGQPNNGNWPSNGQPNNGNGGWPNNGNGGSPNNHNGGWPNNGNGNNGSPNNGNINGNIGVPNICPMSSQYDHETGQCVLEPGLIELDACNLNNGEMGFKYTMTAKFNRMSGQTAVDRTFEVPLANRQVSVIPENEFSFTKLFDGWTQSTVSMVYSSYSQELNYYFTMRFGSMKNEFGVYTSSGISAVLICRYRLGEQEVVQNLGVQHKHVVRIVKNDAYGVIPYTIKTLSQSLIIGEQARFSIEPLVDYGFYSCLTNCTVHNMQNTASIEVYPSCAPFLNVNYIPYLNPTGPQYLSYNLFRFSVQETIAGSKAEQQQLRCWVETRFEPPSGYKKECYAY